MSLIFCHSLGGQPASTLDEIVQEYNKEHDPKVHLVSVSPQNYAAAAKEALEKPPSERPHFILAPEFMTGAMRAALKQGDLISVSSLLDKDRLEDIAEIVVKTFGEDSLPFNPACGVLYTNKNLLKKCGFPDDWKPITFEEMVQAVKSIKEKTGIPYGYTCAWPEAYLVEVMLAQRNLPLLDANGDYDFVQLKDHLLNLRRLVKEGILLLPNIGNYDRTRDAFIQGKVAFYMQGSGHFQIIGKEANEAGFEVGYAPLPTLSMNQDVKYAFPLGGAAIWVFDHRQDKGQSQYPTIQKMVDGVREFLNFLASTAVQAKWHMETAYVPVSQSVCASLRSYYQDHPLHAAVVSQTIEAPLGENSLGIKKENYHLARPKLYPLIHELLLLEGASDDVEKVFEERLLQFQTECNFL